MKESSCKVQVYEIELIRVATEWIVYMRMWNGSICSKQKYSIEAVS